MIREVISAGATSAMVTRSPARNASRAHGSSGYSPSTNNPAEEAASISPPTAAERTYAARKAVRPAPRTFTCRASSAIVVIAHSLPGGTAHDGTRGRSAVVGPKVRPAPEGPEHARTSGPRGAEPTGGCSRREVNAMRSKTTIMAIVLGITILCLGVLAALIGAMGPWLGVATGGGIAAVVLIVYRFTVQPWQHRWGATDQEVRRSMPGDEILPQAKSTTRAITIDAAPERVWPWLVQIRYGRAGWYSYDWIDNDGRPSADRVVPKYQNLEVGDQIVMVPGMGPRVRAIEPNRYILGGDKEAGTWCLAVFRTPEGATRLVSRWRQDWPITPASAFWILISDPGAFIMERRMLRGIKQRAERAAAGQRSLDSPPVALTGVEEGPE